MAADRHTDRQTYTRFRKCSHANVGLAQARPNYHNLRTFHAGWKVFTLVILQLHDYLN